MATIRSFLEALPSVAASPYAFIAYVLVLVAWLVYVWQQQRVQSKSLEILRTFKSDRERNIALRQLLGVDVPPALDPKGVRNWITSQVPGKTRVYIFLAYFGTLLAVLLIVVLVIVTMSGQQRDAVHRTAPAVVAPSKAPTVEITTRPRFDERGSTIETDPIAGSVSGIDIAEHRVVVFAYTNAWWVQPYEGDDCLTPINPDLKWSTRTHFGKEYAVLLVKKDFNWTRNGTQSLPSEGNVVTTVFLRQPEAAAGKMEKTP
jgi:hypothetical protein